MVAVAVWIIGVGGAACIAYGVYKIIRYAQGAHDQLAGIVIGR